jgi:hypothetical protein
MVVRFSDKEIRDALIQLARKAAGLDGAGSATVEVWTIAANADTRIDADKMTAEVTLNNLGKRQ